jgi:hypothetical protein
MYSSLHSANGAGRSAMLYLVCLVVVQTCSCFSVPVTMMALRSETASVPVPVRRRDVMGAFLLATGGQVAALSLLQPKRSYEKPSEWMVAAFQSQKPLSQVPEAGEDFSEQEVYKFERRLRKVAENTGSGDMEKIADAMGQSFLCMEQELCSKTPVGPFGGYE